MRSTLVIGLGLSLGMFACDSRSFAGPEVTPRVAGTVRLGNPAPLIFVDGIRTLPSGLDNLNSRDIETVEVVKGAAAVKLYGEEGRAGVIVISLKRRG